MDLRKIILSTSCMVLLSSPSFAGWDQKTYDNQISVQKQLERLERENEQLRNAIAQMRNSQPRDNRQSSVSSYDARIQALVDENKRLIKQIDQYENQNIDSLSVNKIYSLNQENDNLKIQLRALRETNSRLQKENNAKQDGSQNVDTEPLQKLEAQIRELEKQNTQLKSQNNKLSEVDVSKFENKIQQLIKENAILKQESDEAEQLAQKNTVSMQERIRTLEEKNASLEKLNKNAMNKSQDNLSSLESQIQQLQAENSNLKTEKQAALNLESQIQQLQTENSNLKTEKQTALSQSGNEVLEFKKKIELLEQENQRLQSENKKLEMASNSDEGRLKDDLKSKQDEITNLESELAALKQENTDMIAQLDHAAKNAPKDSNEKLALLEAQNNSLRETIKAQTHSLSQNDNAIQRAEALTTENLMLKNKLELANKAKYSNDETAQDLVKKNQELIEELNLHKQQVANLEGLKETVRQLRDQNDRFQAELTKYNNLDNEVVALQQKNKGLQAEILKYQKKSQEVSDAKSEELDDSAEEKITALRLENQELKARIDILASKNAKTSVVFKKGDGDNNETPSESLLTVEPKKPSVVRYIKEQTEVIAQDVKHVETTYPKVDKVKPLLNQDGGHMFKAVSPEPVQAEEMGVGLRAEDLLKQELKPLSANN